MKYYLNFLFLLLVFSCGENKTETDSTTDAESGANNTVQTDTIRIPDGPININPDKTEYATFSNTAIKDSVNTIHSLGVQLALVAFYDWLKETGAEVDQIEALNYMLMADKNYPGFLLDKNSYVTKAGPLPEIAEPLMKELKEKFNKDLEIPDASFLVYSYLQKNIEFRENLDVTDREFKNEKVYYIYTNENKWDQCNVYYYAFEKDNQFDQGDFIVELYAKDTSDRIFVAQVKPEKTLEATWKKIESKIIDNPYEVRVKTEEGTGVFEFPHRMNGDDFFAMPAIDLMLERSVPELEGTTLKVKGEKKSLDYTSHNLYFRFDNYGVILIEEVKAVDSAAPEEFTLTLPPLVVERPFMITLKRSVIDYGDSVGAKRNIKHLPYFMAWINNTSVMIPYNNKEK